MVKKAKVRIHSDSVLCVGRMSSSRKEARTKWSNQVNEFKMYCAANEFYGIDGEAIEYEWNIPGCTTLQILQEIQKDLRCQNVEPERFSDRIIFKSMFNDIEWEKRKTEETCISNSERVKLYAQQFPQGHRTFIGHGD